MRVQTLSSTLTSGCRKYTTGSLGCKHNSSRTSVLINEEAPGYLRILWNQKGLSLSSGEKYFEPCQSLTLFFLTTVHWIHLLFLRVSLSFTDWQTVWYTAQRPQLSNVILDNIHYRFPMENSFLQSKYISTCIRLYISCRCAITHWWPFCP